MSDNKKEETLAAKYIRIFLNMGFTILSFLLVIVVGPKLLGFFMPFVIGWVIAMIANPLVRFLEKRLKIVRKHSSAVIMILTIGIIAVGGYFIVSKSIIEMIRFLHDVPELYQQASAEFDSITNRFSNLLLLLPDNTREILITTGNNMNEYIGNIVQTVGKPTMETAGAIMKNIPNVLIHLIVTLISSYFFIADRDKMVVSIRTIMPKSLENLMDMIYKQFKAAVGGYFKAQFKIMGVVAVILFIGFLIMDIPYALVLALLLAFLDFLPFFGTGTALIPWGLIKFLAGDYQYATGLVIIYLTSQLVRQLIQPKIVGDSLGLNPLLTLLFMYIGYKWRGLTGMILAVPIGLILIKFYELGAFRGITDGIREIAEDINQFRKSNRGK